MILSKDIFYKICGIKSVKKKKKKLDFFEVRFQTVVVIKSSLNS